ncbi:MAG TPA: ABC transporter ATP-binding protein [Methylomirabilota bacterium]|nr:ABC transporter ATP-binding protein [Methylomirabilota bacterium]
MAPLDNAIRSEAPSDTPLAVELRGVGFDYRTDGRLTQAVQDVSLGVPRGATVAFVGPSGCGKSTLLKLVAGLLRATRGAVVIDGWPVEAPLKNVGMAFQNPVLLPWRTVLGNLLLPLEILRENGDRRAVDRALWEDRAVELLRTVGLAGAERRHPRELSGGMRQRVSLCRALIHEPELLLLDEPFAALDAFTREEMWELHQRLRQGREFTGVLVTHDLREAAFLARTIYVMSANPGRVAHVHEVDLAFPRALADVYSPVTTELIRLMREQIRPVASAT